MLQQVNTLFFFNLSIVIFIISMHAKTLILHQLQVLYSPLKISL